MSKTATQQNDWQEVKLGVVCQKIGDGLHGTPKYSDGDYFFINGNNIANGKIVIKKDTKRVNYEEFRKHKKELNENTILLSINGTIGNLAIYKGEKCILGKSAAYINAKEDVSKYFLYYLMLDNKFQSDISINANGSTIKNVSLEQLRNYSFILPPLPEQKAIAEVLSSLDDKIDLLHRQNKILEDIAQALFRKWFIDKVDDGWEEKPLDEVADFLNGLACQKYPPESGAKKLPVLKIKELGNGITGNSDWVTVNVDEKYIVELGDVIFSWSGSLLLKVWNGQKCVLNQHLFKVTSKEYPRWFYYFWTKHYLEKFIGIADSKATTMGHIKRSDLSNSAVLIPTTDELTSMDEKMTPLFEKTILNIKQIRTLKNLRDLLLPKLMNGEVRVAEFNK